MIVRLRRYDARGVAAVLGAVLLAAGCTGGEPDDVEAAQATPEPTIESLPESEEPTDEPSATEDPEPEPEPEQTIGEDDPLYAPLPDLEPDPENDVPDDIEQLILDAYADAYATERELYAAAELDDEALRRTHFGPGYDAVSAAIDHLREEGGRELSPDSTVTRVYVVDFQGGSAIVRECVESGPRTGLYDIDSEVLLRPVDWNVLARDRMMELTSWTSDEEPSYRATQVGFAPTDECS